MSKFLKQFIKMAKSDKKAQAHMSETVAVIFIFFVLILFGLLFYSRYQNLAYKEEQQEILEKRAIATTLRAIFLPELLCTKGDAEPEDDCLDMWKVEAMHGSDFLESRLANYYFDIFSYAKISVHQVYPPAATGAEPEEWVLYNQEPPVKKTEDNTPIEPNYQPSYFGVTLRKEEISGLPSYHFGYLEVGVYS